MQDRKVLTLNEVLNLDRRPTLQEMVDLSIEDYTKYLYQKGIIKYMPEKLEDYEPTNDNDYDPDCDVVLELHNPKLEENYDLDNRICPCFWDFNSSEENMLNESLGTFFEEINLPLISKNGREFVYSYSKDEDNDYFYYIIPKSRM